MYFLGFSMLLGGKARGNAGEPSIVRRPL